MYQKNTKKIWQSLSKRENDKECSQYLTPPARIYLFNGDAPAFRAGFIFKVHRGCLKLNRQVLELLGLSPLHPHDRHSIRSVGFMALEYPIYGLIEYPFAL
ncbi:MAG: hypothetical protein DRI83_09150 [Bacteroidetes bacterium]|nr:MAG: hypothetical protein DRI83_09150 [Bacteroidota bacterium]